MKVLICQNIVPALSHFWKEVVFAVQYVNCIIEKQICVKSGWHHIYVVKSSMTNKRCRLCMILYTFMASSVQIPL